jgi:hypothetical protein
MKENIEYLISRYFNAESTLEEEAKLSEYFEGKDIDPELMKYKSWFDFKKSEKEIVLRRDAGFNLQSIARNATINPFYRNPKFLMRFAAISTFLVASTVFYLSNRSKVSTQSAFSHQLNKVDTLDTVVKPPLVIPDLPKNKINRLAESKPALRKSKTIAAANSSVLGVGRKVLAPIAIQQNNDQQPTINNQVVNEQENPELAYQEIKAALLLVSASLKKGTAPAEEGLGKVREATELFHSTDN